MFNVSSPFHDIHRLTSMLIKLSANAWRFVVLCLRSTPALAAEILFQRKQLALYEERQVKPRRATDATRLTMVWLSRFFNLRSALRIVKPDTFTGWYCQGFRLFWRWKSKPGRAALPKDLRTLVANAVCERVIGTIRRDCLDFMIPLNERHLYRILKEWMTHYNEGRPHKSLGPGIPQPKPGRTILT